jgi:Na+-driven multidrug efflux pump
MNTQTTNENPLGTQPVKKLLMQFAIPSIVAMLVSSLYNIVDQFFIGRNVGELGNAATNISFPSAAHLLLIWLWEKEKRKKLFIISAIPLLCSLAVV